MYFIYFVVIPVLIIALLCLATDNKPQATTQAGGDKAGVPVKGWIQCILAVLMMIAYASFPLNRSLYVVRDAAIGDASSVGIGMSLVTVVAALVGLILPQIIKGSKLYISSVGAVFGLAATLLVIFSTNMIMIYIAAILDGIFLQPHHHQRHHHPVGRRCGTVHQRVLYGGRHLCRCDCAADYLGHLPDQDPPA